MSAHTPRADAASHTLRYIGDEPLSIDDVALLARGALTPALSQPVKDLMRKSADLVARLHAKGDAIYGVTTSVGASVDTNVPHAQAADLSLNVLRMHGCGTGRILDDVESAASWLVDAAAKAS